MAVLRPAHRARLVDTRRQPRAGTEWHLANLGMECPPPLAALPLQDHRDLPFMEGCPHPQVDRDLPFMEGCPHPQVRYPPPPRQGLCHTHKAHHMEGK